MTDALEARVGSSVALQPFDEAVADYTDALALTPADNLIDAKRAIAYAACGDVEQIAKPGPLF